MVATVESSGRPPFVAGETGGDMGKRSARAFDLFGFAGEVKLSCMTSGGDMRLLMVNGLYCGRVETELGVDVAGAKVDDDVDGNWRG